jgi:hypothetical protein
MNMTTKKDIFKEKIAEYLKADKERKGAIIDGIVEVTGLHRKSVVRALKRTQRRNPLLLETRGRPTYYTRDVTAALKELWDINGEPCAENLHSQVGSLIDTLERDRMWSYGEETSSKLRAMSIGTMKSRLKQFNRTLLSFGGRGTTTPGSIINQIPIRMDGWDTASLGTMQIDTVAHCGDSVAGDFVYTVNAVDVATLWSTRRAQWNKGMTATVANMKAMEDELPFSVIEWHPDSGSEFINQVCYREFGDRLTRSRPYHKNDNCFVEERNGHVVRRWIGYERFDVPELVDALNDFYGVLTTFLNHFVASRRIVSKERVGAKWKITREKVSKTPYERILERSDASPGLKEKLQQEHEQLNPKGLREQIEEKRKIVFNILYRHN